MGNRAVILFKMFRLSQDAESPYVPTFILDGIKRPLKRNQDEVDNNLKGDVIFPAADSWNLLVKLGFP